VDIVGRGFIARHASEYFRSCHPEATLIGAGVSSVVVTDAESFSREAELVYEVLRRCRADGRTAILLSTASAGMYGAPDSPGTEDGPVFPLTPYGRHKLGLESVCATSGARWLVLRLAHIVGPGQQPHQLLPSLTRQLVSGQITIYRDASRDLLGVRDMLAMLDALLTRGVHDEIVNLATGRPEPVEHIVDELERRLATSAVRTYVDMPTKHAIVSTAKARSLIPDFERFGFGTDYLGTLLDQHTAELASSVQ